MKQFKTTSQKLCELKNQGYIIEINYKFSTKETSQFIIDISYGKKTYTASYENFDSAVTKLYDSIARDNSKFKKFVRKFTRKLAGY